VVQFESQTKDDFQLNLVENYILKLRHLKEMKKRLATDFKFLIQENTAKKLKARQSSRTLDSHNEP
jgi:hypothetical protein